MKVLIISLLAAILFACNTSNKRSDSDPKETGIDPQVALEVLNDYVTNKNALSNPGKWVQNNPRISRDFKKAYQTMIDEAYKEDPELGLDFDPILNAQDFPERGFEIKAVDSKKGLVTLQGIDWPDFVVETKLTEINGRWFLDGAGVIRIK